MKRWKWIGGLLLAALLLARPEAAALGAAQAMSRWCTAVAPALFPFLALMPLLTCREAALAYERLLGPATRALFRLPGAAASAMLIGAVAGTPAGAIAARDIASRSNMNRGQLCRVVAAFTGFSPAFLVGGIGVGLLNSAALGWKLLCAQGMTQLILALLLRRAWEDRTEPVPAANRGDAEQPVRAAVFVALTVCGYMALFGSVGCVVREIAGRGASDALLCLLDVPSGAGLLAKAGGSEVQRLALLGAMCGFGGLCLASQNLSALRGCGMPVAEYMALRVLAAAICSGCAALLANLPDGLASGFMKPDPSKALPMAALLAAAMAVPVLLRLKKT